MYEPARHVPLVSAPWDADIARAAIVEIVEDALARYGAEKFWPAHPMDDGLEDGATNLYFGATGVIWALDYLHRCGAVATARDFRPVLPALLAANQRETAAYGSYARYASLLMNDVGVLLTTMRLAPRPAVADQLYARMRDN